jgi:uncharacterized protein (TIGR02996 family)
MDPADGFLDAICADPDDDTPRLVYADWLEEHGEPERAEFIRCQCLVERWASTPGDHEGGAAAGATLARAQQLLRADGFPPALPFRHVLHCFQDSELTPLDPGCAVAVWRRGFVASVTLSCADWLKHGPTVVACQPVESVTLSDRGPGDPAGVHSVGFLWLPWPRPRDAAPGARFWTPRSRPDVLPWPLYEAVCECRDKNVAETDDDCRRWLSAGCVRWGREEARKLRHALS